MRFADGLLRLLSRRVDPFHRAEEAALAAIVRSSQDAVIGKTLDGTITSWNAGATLLYGHAAEEVLGRRIDTMFPADAAVQERIRHERVAGGIAESGYRCRRLRRDGSEIQVVMSMAPIRDAKGRLTGVASISRPVNDQERAESHYASLLDASPDGMFGADKDGRITMVNAQLIQLLGYSRAELVGAPVELLLPEASREGHGAHRTEFLQSPRTRQMGVGKALAVRRRDGSTFPIEVTISADGTGDDVIMIGAIRDVTQQRETEAVLSVQLAELSAARDQAVVATQAKNSFLSRTSHELRTPLNAILGFAQLLEMAELGDDDRDSAVRILGAGRHLLTLINELIDTARIEAGQLRLSMEPVAIQSVIDDVVTLIGPLASAGGIAVRQEPSSRPLAAQADAQRLRQVLINLVSNAVKYNRHGGTVSIGCRPSGPGSVEIYVTDTGLGLTPAEIDRIFVPFDRLDAGLGGIEGTGIGLPLALGLAEAMHGRIEVFSTPGTGSTFTVVLPAAADIAPAAHTPLIGDLIISQRTADSAPSPDQFVVVSIEDNEANTLLLRRFFDGLPGITLHSASSGKAGIDLFIAYRPDLVLLDLHLPDLPGEDVYARLRAESGNEQPAIVVLSADATPGALGRMLTRGVDNYLTKPVDLRQLQSIIEGLRTKKKPAANAVGVHDSSMA